MFNIYVHTCVQLNNPMFLYFKRMVLKRMVLPLIMKTENNFE